MLPVRAPLDRSPTGDAAARILFASAGDPTTTAAADDAAAAARTHLAGVAAPVGALPLLHSAVSARAAVPALATGRGALEPVCQQNMNRQMDSAR